MEREYKWIYTHRDRTRNFCLGGLSCDNNIFIKTSPHTHTNIYIYMYVCIHALPKEKSLVFSFKIMFDGDSFIK